MQKQRIAFTLNSDLSELTRLHDHLARFAGSIGLSREKAFKLNLALDELFTNVVSHGYADESPHEVEVTVDHEDGLLTVRMADDGVPFNPVEAENPDPRQPLADRTNGGLGVMLVKRCMTDIRYERRGGKNIVTMTKCL